MRSSREAIYSALFGLINVPSLMVGGEMPWGLMGIYLSPNSLFNTIARSGKLWTEFTAGQFPVLQQVEPDESYTYPQGDAAPPKVVLAAEFWIYIRADDPNTSPSSILNPLIDAVENAILPANRISPYSNQTLGDLVQWTRIDGGSHKAPGYIDNVGMAILPIKMLVPF